MSPITLLGAGNVERGSLYRALRIAPYLVAADGGANVAVAAGHVPDAVIGDLDSVNDAARSAIPDDRFHCVAEQETTDFEKCLQRIEAPFILGLGFAGPRADHTLAVWNALSRHGHRRCLILGREDVAFIAPRRIGLALAPGTRVSLFPMAAVTGTSRGLRWPIGGLHFAPDGRVGTSNEATGPVEMEFEVARMLVILPKAALKAAIAGLQASAW
ncbi:thiamine diphosphokinase [Defluviimonas sp. SAOS-178_SWC]|uniref:thiamine diphosphokinase n=1 Tax=Defluviimonas sp. SAOS-178_SWC TaxID=3121287 RepID=UPI003221492E